MNLEAVLEYVGEEDDVAMWSVELDDGDVVRFVVYYDVDVMTARQAVTEWRTSRVSEIVHDVAELPALEFATS